jgi:3'(2'), 5'-bisphosphate nucleotidase
MKMPADTKLVLPPASVLIDEITTIVSQASAAILAIDTSTLAKRIKSDRSPVTAADDASQSVILAGLSRFFPSIPIVSEEASGAGQISGLGATFFLVDPLDGTREFVAGRDEYTVNIALVNQGAPVFGCIGSPAFGLIWRGVLGQGAERLELTAGANANTCRARTPLRTRQLPSSNFVVAVSRSHFDSRTEHFLAHFPRAERIACGSSLKFCRVAEGHVDLYPRLAPTHEWDIAAGHAILAAAGGMVAKPSGEPLTYGRFADGFCVPDFVAFGDPTAAARISRIALS